MSNNIKTKLKKNSIPFQKVLENHYKKHPDSKVRIKAREGYYETLMNIRETRKKLGYTLEEVEQLSGVPKATISKIERGKRNPTFRTLMSIAESMGKVLEIKLK